MIFVDASHYLSLLLKDRNYAAALKQSHQAHSEDLITSQAILGEVLTVGSMRFSRSAAIFYVQQVIDAGTRVILENKQCVTMAWTIFRQVESKDVGWVDCYSLAIMQQLEVSALFSFDQDLQKLAKKYVGFSTS